MSEEVTQYGRPEDMTEDHGWVGTFRPLYDRLVVIPENDPLEQRAQAAGLHLPEMMSRPKPQKGVVLAIGPGWTDHHGERREVPVTVGTTVLFAQMAGQEITIDDQQYIILGSGDLLGFIDERSLAEQVAEDAAE